MSITGATGFETGARSSSIVSAGSSSNTSSSDSVVSEVAMADSSVGSAASSFFPDSAIAPGFRETSLCLTVSITGAAKTAISLISLVSVFGVALVNRVSTFDAVWIGYSAVSSS